MLWIATVWAFKWFEVDRYRMTIRKMAADLLHLPEDCKRLEVVGCCSMVSWVDNFNSSSSEVQPSENAVFISTTFLFIKACVLLGCDKSLDSQGAIRLKQKVPECKLSFILKMTFLEQFFLDQFRAGNFSRVWRILLVRTTYVTGKSRSLVWIRCTV